MHPIARDLREKSYSITADFVSPAAVRDYLKDLENSGEPKAAGTGKSKIVNEDIRRDKILWREEAPPELEELRVRLNRELFLGLRSIEGHYARYPAGGFYRRHLDRFRADDARTVSFILYLNENWKPADGGRLRLYLKNEEVDIDPVGGTLVCFMSGEIEHEVLESHAPRFSYTGWMKT